MALAGDGVSKWVAHNFGIQAASSPGYTMLAWVKTLASSQSVPVSWAGAVNVHSWIYSFAASGFPDGYGFDDRDNAGNVIGQNIAQPHGGWVPVVVSKQAQVSPPGAAIYVTSIANTVGSFGTNLGAQTLTDLYVGSAEDQVNGIIQPGEGVAEVAIWTGALGPTESAQLLAGACPLTVAQGRLLCYFPFKGDMRDYGPSGLQFVGPAPKFVDHPPVEDFRTVLGALQSDYGVLPLAPVTGTLVATTGNAALVAAGGPRASGTLVATTGAATLVGIASNGQVTGRLATATADATLVAAGGPRGVGTLSATTGAATLVGAASVNNPVATAPVSIITIGAIPEQEASTPFNVNGTYSLYPSLSFSDDASGVQTPIAISNTTPYGLATFSFTHPGETPGQHLLTIQDTLTSDSASTSYLVDQFGNVIVPFPPPGPALTLIIPAYLYEQYYDDANLQAFITSYNSMAQNYLDWFNGINLPIYTGPLISGALLDWVAQGLYGISRPTLALVKSRSVGPYNTYTLDSLAFNASRTTGTATVFNATDDIFKRIITWSFYKADGKIFSVKWLKRRIMRFLAGVNGTDYTGPTYQVSVTFAAGNTLNIKITQGMVELSAAPVFQVALLSGVLPIPFKYIPSVTIPA